MCKVLIQLKLTVEVRDTQFLVFCSQTDRGMDRQADSSIAQKTFILQGYNEHL